MSLEASLSILSLAEPVPEGAIDLKSLVFKPKTPKTQTPVPVIVIARHTTQTPSKIIAQEAEAKDPRLANDALTTEFFGVSAKEFTIASLSVEKHKDSVKILLDATISDDEGTQYVISSQSARLLLNGKQLAGFLAGFGPKTVDFSKAPTQAAAAPKKQSTKSQKQQAAEAQLDDAKLIGVTVDKEKDFPGWYQQILTKGEMLDYYDVSGCYILRPGSYSVWENIQLWFDKKIKENGVHNAYFPMFVSSKVLNKEKDHIEGFAPEVAWVTRAGSSELEEPIAIRPTSETVMYPYYAKWIRSHRDLPLKLNQWNSVVRWEFKHPQPFLRTREFLWQEGHTAHLTGEEAEEQVLHILGLYEKVFTDLLALPVIKGKKTENEKFAGGYYTTTCEGYIPTTGRGIQCATSHNLGQNFSKMFNITVENPDGHDKPKVFVHQTSWGLSTRVIGVMVMVHSDNKGLVIPPRVAQFQTVIIPVGLTAKTSKDVEEKVYETCKNLEARLKADGIRVASDFKDNYSPGWKFSQWELKGVPVRLEVGPKDVATESVLAVRRDTGAKISIKISEIDTKLPELFDEIHNNLYQTAKDKFDSHRVLVHNWKDFIHNLNQKNVVVAPWCGDGDCEDEIKKASAKKDNGEEFEIDEKAPSMGAKSLCIPFDQPELKPGEKCVRCGKPAVNYTMFGRSY
ncbi:DEKNAAC101756 [Brettanomyces naardenensis]|uniref:proline--tRNA ligase n=1 Tax=Brettanomyces naardenensis TaxID=13370 RepID=A0A448YIS3_BRENA|nr:DEKNAAC101756 [Brettanomyces naardenensis]